MKKNNKITPEGTRDLLFRECEALRKVQSILRDLFEAQGYGEVITPGFEFYDVFSSNSMYFPQENMYKLIDNKGRLLVMRPDSTIPIARMTSTKLKNHTLPIKLYYSQRVYRQQPEHRGKNSEIMQMGIELIGLSTFESDLEVLTLGIESLTACTKKDFRIEIGHIGIFKFLMESLKTDQEIKNRVHKLISAKNYTALSDLLENVTSSSKDDPTFCLESRKSAELLKELPKLFGGKEALERAKELFHGYDSQPLQMLSYLEKIYDGLAARGLQDKLIIDFGLVNQAEYYSSLIFRGYVDRSGEPVLSGGRYDELFRDFGDNLPATGFGINVDQLRSNLLKEEEGGISTKPENTNKLRIALTKGRLEKDVVQLFSDMGYDVSNLIHKGRKLLLDIPHTNIQVVLAKAADVITYVEHGVCDMGVVGKDTISEMGGRFYEVLDLGLGKCKFALAVPENADFYNGYNTKRIATKYPKVTADFFENKGMDIEIIKIEGSVELAPLLDLADGIVDIVETGTTLKENGLKVIEDIKNISARIIVNEAGMKLKKNSIEEIVGKIKVRIK